MEKVTSIYDIIQDNIDVRGKTVVDIGSGPGKMVRWLARQGAQAFGVEVGPQSLAKVYYPEGLSLHYIMGGGEGVPLRDDLADFVFFMFSLHHIPDMVLALREARRVLKPKGQIVIVEPLVKSASDKIMQPIDDETAVRQQAEVAMQSLKNDGLRETTEKFFVMDDRYRDPDQFIDALALVDSARKPLIAAHRGQMVELFYQYSRKSGGEYLVESGMRLNIFASV